MPLAITFKGTWQERHLKVSNFCGFLGKFVPEWLIGLSNIDTCSFLNVGYTGHRLHYIRRE